MEVVNEILKLKNKYHLLFYEYIENLISLTVSTTAAFHMNGSDDGNDEVSYQKLRDRNQTIDELYDYKNQNLTGLDSKDKRRHYFTYSDIMGIKASASSNLKISLTVLLLNTIMFNLYYLL